MKPVINAPKAATSASPMYIKWHKYKNLYQIKEKEYHHSFWMCYIIDPALCIGAISSLLLPVPHDHLQAQSNDTIGPWTHIKSHQKYIQSLYN